MHRTSHMQGVTPSPTGASALSRSWRSWQRLPVATSHVRPGGVINVIAAAASRIAAAANRIAAAANNMGASSQAVPPDEKQRGWRSSWSHRLRSLRHGQLLLSRRPQQLELKVGLQQRAWLRAGRPAIPWWTWSRSRSAARVLGGLWARQLLWRLSTRRPPSPLLLSPPPPPPSPPPPSPQLCQA